MIPTRLQDEIAAWLEFYHELGIEEFLIEPRELGARAQLPAPDSRPLTSDLEATAGVSMENRQSSIGVQPTPDPAIAPGAQLRVPDSRPLTPAAVPARSLNLFEAEAPRRSERETLDQIR